MYIIRSGLVNTVLNASQYEKVKNNEMVGVEIPIEETVQIFTNDKNEQVEYLPFKISYKDVDSNGKERYIYNDEKKEFQQNYFYSPVIYAYGKEMRILLELGNHAPIKLVYQEQWKDGKLYRTAVCIQNQRMGIKDGD